MKTQWVLICMLIFALITAIFAVINVGSVEVNFLFAQTSVPLIIVILTSTLLGGFIVGLFGIIRQYKLQRKVKQLEKQLLESTAIAAAPAAGEALPEQALPESASPTIH